MSFWCPPFNVCPGQLPHSLALAAALPSLPCIGVSCLMGEEGTTTDRQAGDWPLPTLPSDLGPAIRLLSVTQL